MPSKGSRQWELSPPPLRLPFTFRLGASGGPLGQTQDYIVQQGGVFCAPNDGAYTFRTGSCDGSWLGIDGQVGVNNYGIGRLT